MSKVEPEITPHLYCLLFVVFFFRYRFALVVRTWGVSESRANLNCYKTHLFQNKSDNLAGMFYFHEHKNTMRQSEPTDA